MMITTTSETGTTKATIRTAMQALAVAAVLVAGAGVAQAADSTETITPPSATDLALLRGLLALQHPALRGGAAAVVVPTSAAPTMSTTPAQPVTGETHGETEGEACGAACGVGAETSAARTARISEDFRATLQRAVAAAGFTGDRM